MPRWTTLALGAALAVVGCAPSAPLRPFNPELFVPAHDAAKVSNCTLTRRAEIPLNLRALVLAEARINGGPATLVLDTGAQRSIITRDAAKRLGVTDRYDFNDSISGIGAVIPTGDARLQSFALGGTSFAYPRILVGGVNIGPLGAQPPDGLLGADLLGDYDLDIDVPHRRLTLYDQTSCDTLRPPWDGRAGMLETTRSLSAHPFFPVEIDGHTLTATLDSGAQRTVVGARAAAQLGLNPATTANDPSVQTRGAGGEVLRAVLHQFRQFRVGSDALRSPVLVSAIALPRDVDVILGLDYLATRRLFLSYGSRRIFVQPPR